MRSKALTGLAAIALSFVVAACTENGFGSRSGVTKDQGLSGASTAPTHDANSPDQPGAPTGRD